MITVARAHPVSRTAERMRSLQARDVFNSGFNLFDGDRLKTGEPDRAVVGETRPASDVMV